MKKLGRLMIPATMATLKLDSTAAIKASAEPTATFTESPTKAMAAFSAPRISTKSTCKPSRSKKPSFQAAQTGLKPRVLEATLIGKRFRSWAELTFAKARTTRPSHIILL
jgi:hypothetical protein